MIYGDRIRQVRELRGLTQQTLAAAVQLHQSAIAHLEADRATISAGVLERIALFTGFPAAFFRQRPERSFPAGSLRFRAHARVTSRDRTCAYRYAQTIYEAMTRLAARVTKIPLKIQRLSSSPIEAARETRRALGLSSAEPISNLINAVELAGVVVVALPVSNNRVDAFSAWVGDGGKDALIAIVGGKPGDRLRFNVVHELAHLILHETLEGNRLQIEREAHAFAAEFLMPESGIRRDFRPPITLALLAQLKPRWGVSIQAMIRRARDLDIITTNQYRYLCQQIGARGWRVKEPDQFSVAPEKPRGFRKMVEVVYGTTIASGRVVADLNLSQDFVAEVMACYTTSNELGFDQPSAAVVPWAVARSRAARRGR